MSDDAKFTLIKRISADILEQYEASLSEVGIELSDHPSEENQCALYYKGETNPDEYLPGLSIYCPSDLKSFLKNGGRGFFNPEILNSNVGKKIVRRALGENSSIALEEAFGTENIKAGTFRISDYYSVGHYIDILTVKAQQNDIRPISVANFFCNLMNFFAFLSQSKIIQFPVNIDFANSEDTMFVQASISTKFFGKDLIFDFLGEGEKDLPPFFNSLLNSVDILDMYKLKNSQKLVVTGIWFSQSLEYPSFLITDINSFALTQYETFLNNFEGSISIVQLKDEVDDSSIKTEELEKYLSSIKRNGKGTILQARRLAEFSIKKFKSMGISIENATMIHLNTALNDFPLQNKVQELTTEDKAFILECVKNKTLFEDVHESFVVAMEKIGNDRIVDEIISRISSIEFQEVIETVAISNKESIEDAAQRFSKDRDEVQNTLIKGDREDVGEERIIIKGSRSGPEEVWKVKRLEVVEELKNKVANLKGSDSPYDLENQLVQIVKSKLNLDEEDSYGLAKGILESSAETFLDDEIISGKSAKLKIENQKLKELIGSKNTQVDRMKQLISKMRNEIVKSKSNAQNGNDGIPVNSSEQDNKIKGLQISLENKDKEIARHVKAIEHQKELLDNISEKKDRLINDLENKLSGYVQQRQENNESEKLKAKSSQLREENTKLLDAQKRNSLVFEELNKKIDILEENKKSDAIKDKAKDIFKIENAKLLAEVKDLQADRERLLNENEALRKQMVIIQESKKGEIKGAIKENDKSLEEMRIQMNEALSNEKSTKIMVKQLEHKNKFLSSQLQEAEKANKKAGVTHNGASTQNIDSVAKHRIKQLEVLNQKLEQTQSKAISDLSDKKKEMHKMKTENAALKNRLNELERKAGKKAS